MRGADGRKVLIGVRRWWADRRRSGRPTVGRDARALPAMLATGSIRFAYAPVRRLTDSVVVGIRMCPQWPSDPGVDPRHAARPDAARPDADEHHRRLRRAAAAGGIADDLDRYVVESAARHLPSVVHGLQCDEPWLAVPIGASSLESAEFVDGLLDRLDEQGLTPEGFVFELDRRPRGELESTAVDRLRDLGVWFSVPRWDAAEVQVAEAEFCVLDDDRHVDDDTRTLRRTVSASRRRALRTVAVATDAEHLVRLRRAGVEFAVESSRSSASLGEIVGRVRTEHDL
ncbi:MAG: EAL domain-containing protein [Ilumatobacteraceae bacterium]